MLHSEFIHKLNKGTFVHNGTVRDDPTADFDVITYREDLLNSFLYSVDVYGVIVGVKPVTFVDNEKLNVMWSISVLTLGRFNEVLAKPVETLSEQEIKSTELVKAGIQRIESENLDVESEFSKLGLSPFEA